jgi:hypothetical protein
VESAPGSSDDSPLSYYRPVPAPPWELVASFRNAGQWHAASAILQRSGIPSRMADDPANPSAVGMLVPAPEVELARQLLGLPVVSAAERPVVSPIESRPVGINPNEPPPLPPLASRIRQAIPVDPPNLSDRQRRDYSIAIVFLWLLLILLVIVMALAIAAGLLS